MQAYSSSSSLPYSTSYTGMPQCKTTEHCGSECVSIMAGWLCIRDDVHISWSWACTGEFSLCILAPVCTLVVVSPDASCSPVTPGGPPPPTQEASLWCGRQGAPVCVCVVCGVCVCGVCVCVVCVVWCVCVCNLNNACQLQIWQHNYIMKTYILYIHVHV